MCVPEGIQKDSTGKPELTVCHQFNIYSFGESWKSVASIDVDWIFSPKYKKSTLSYENLELTV